jgi:nitrite reductase/ring-hydroxylating ferredoxin subunit
MPDTKREVCQSHALIERGQGVRFALPELGEHTTGFVVRYNGKAYAFVNQCAHVPIELDLNPGKFFRFQQKLPDMRHTWCTLSTRNWLLRDGTVQRAEFASD